MGKKAAAPKQTKSRNPAAPRMGTGVEGLNDILEGGFPANRIYLVEGEPGTGKTTIALQFLLEGARLGEAGLYVTLSETREELQAVAESHGWSLEGFHIYELVPLEESLKPEAQYTIFHPSEVELGETTSAVLQEVERLKPRRIVFDSLSEMRLLAGEALRFRRQILALKQYFAAHQSTVLLLDDKVSDGRDLQVQSIAHGVLSLEHLAVEYGAERRRLRVVKLRGSRFSGGYHDFNIETGGIRVFPRLVAAEHRQDFAPEPVSSGLPELDSLLAGGLDRGTSTLVIGPAGSGKSTLTAQFAASAAARGDHTAVYIFDEIRETYIARSAGIGTDMRGYVDKGLIKIQQIDPAEVAPGEFASRVIDSVNRDGARVVIIDSLNGYLNAMPEERFLTIQMHELLTCLNQQGVATLLVMAQHGFLGSSMATPVDVSYLADTVLMLRYFEAGGAVRRALSVVKKRSGAHENTIREFQLSSDGIYIGEPLTEFRGVLTGVPLYAGSSSALIEESGDGD
ncbi:MAG TPA: ATPase domain-containing protein [Pyrinomonadaceae bacterium]|jgi:circadian clock protein KaiC|nr:ATPase domain-containing protein [Pyrinomonadaceae bacterium]